MKETLLGYFTAIVLIIVAGAYVEHEFGILNLLEWLCGNYWDSIELSMSGLTHEVGQWLSQGQAYKNRRRPARLLHNAACG